MRKHKGFTLVELVVVVMILGILAAVAAPKLLNTSSTATDNGIKQSLAVMRDAIERFAAEHGGQLPGGDAATEVLFTDDIKAYLRGAVIPTCPVGPENNEVRVVGGALPIVAEDEGTAVKSWAYCSGTGQFICNLAKATKSDPDVQYDEL
jgi:prepilin-type N-terminal cleavage/methylation domain-containing protein